MLSPSDERGPNSILRSQPPSSVPLSDPPLLALWIPRTWLHSTAVHVLVFSFFVTFYFLVVG